jgi:hypothetical protein
MFALSGNRNRDLMRSRRVIPPLRHIGRRLHNPQSIFRNPHRLFLVPCDFLGGIFEMPLPNPLFALGLHTN